MEFKARELDAEPRLPQRESNASKNPDSFAISTSLAYEGPPRNVDEGRTTAATTRTAQSKILIPNYPYNSAAG
jgi:hypothetical protein